MRPRVPSLAFWVYPWDMIAEGPERAAARIRAAGATTVFVAAVYHPVEQVQPHLGCRTYTIQDTSFWFDARDAGFGRSVLQPSVPPVFGCTDPLEEIARACHQAGLELRAWIVCCHSETFGKLHPKLCQLNCLGEVLSATLCPSRPEVQIYHEILIRFLVRQYGLDGVILESFQFHPWLSVTPYQKRAHSFSVVERYFQGLCVCPECRMRASTQGVDTEHVVRFACSVLAGSCAERTPAQNTIAGTLAADSDLLGYHEARRRTLQGTVARCHSAATPGSSGQFLLWDECTTGISLEKVSESVTDVLDLFHSATPEEAASIGRQRFSCATITPANYWASLCGSTADLSSAMGGLWSVGARNFAIYNYGTMTFRQCEIARTAFESVCSVVL